MKKRPITLIIPFFGPVPAWQPFFLKSCYANNDVSFLIFADHICPGIDRNVRVVQTNLEELRIRAMRKLQMNVSLESAYKICDFRPAFGLIFEEYLKDSWFWGTCDTDIVFGNIRKIVTDEVLANYDIITAKREYLVGHFTLYRNAAITNRLFLESADYREVFQSPRSYAFDECNFLWWKLLSGGDILSTPSRIESMSHVVKRLTAKGRIRAYFESHVIEQDKLLANGSLEELSNRLFWDNGVLYDQDDKTEYLSFHFHFLKKDPAFIIPFWKEVPNEFHISQNGFSLTTKTFD
ncbi:hypothetical protein GCM10011325_35540 [Dyadobacter sediminis]|nr:hypothetical protein GCM10011325_35540 [Dyadobacter sediminis]